MKKIENLRIRLTEIEKQVLEKKAKDFNFASLSEYLRFIGLNCKEIQIKF